jgi:hypothetical protein
MVQKAVKNNGRRKRKGGPATPEGRQRQIASRLNHGIRSRAPVLSQVESPQEWQQHLEGYRAYYAPVGEVEENLVYLISYQDWKLIVRLLPYECDRTFKSMTNSDEFSVDSASPEVVREILNGSEERLRAQVSMDFAKLARYSSLLNGSHDLVFSKSEVEEILSWIAEQIQEHLENDEDHEDSDAEGDDLEQPLESDEGTDADDPLRDITVEDRPWTAAEIRRQLAIMGEAANRSWREELSNFPQAWEIQLNSRSDGLDKAKTHLCLNRVLGLKQLERVNLYERQILGTRRALMNQLERHQARRLGQPIAAPLALDLVVSSNERSIQPDVP